MKSLKFITLSFITMVITGYSVSAQKIGSVDAEGLVFSLPEIQTVQQKLQQFQTDSIGAEYTRLAKEFQQKDSIYKDSKTSASVKQAMEKDYGQLQGTLMNWQDIAGRANQAKQAELMAPLSKKVSDAISAIAKEQGYTHVLTREAFLVAPPSDDLTLAVAKKLGINTNNNPAPATGQKPALPATVPKK